MLVERVGVQELVGELGTCCLCGDVAYLVGQNGVVFN